MNYVSVPIKTILLLLALPNETHQGMVDRYGYYRYDNGNDNGNNGGFGTNSGGGYPMAVSYDQYGGLRLGGYVNLCLLHGAGYGSSDCRGKIYDTHSPKIAFSVFLITPYPMVVVATTMVDPMITASTLMQTMQALVVAFVKWAIGTFCDNVQVEDGSSSLERDLDTMEEEY